MKQFERTSLVTFGVAMGIAAFLSFVVLRKRLKSSNERAEAKLFVKAQLAAREFRARRGKEPNLHRRQWQLVLDSTNFQTNSTLPITVMQFNILADGLSGRDLKQRGGFSECPIEALDFEYRRDRILEEIVRHGSLPDIIAMEEVDHFEIFEKELGALGYRGVFQKKPNSPCKALSGDTNLEDGCALFWRIDRLCQKDDKAWRLCYDDINLETWKSNGMKANQVAILIELAVLGAEGTTILTGVTHLKAKKNADGEKIRTAQVKQLLDFVQQKRAECARRNKTPVILCMDMNAAPPEQGHDYPSEAYPSALAHPIIPLRSAYGVAMDGQEPPWTTWKIRTKGTKRFEIRHTIDYILISSDIEVTKVLCAPDDSELTSRGLPGWSYPSDHIALAAKLFVPAFS